MCVSEAFLDAAFGLWLADEAEPLGCRQQIAKYMDMWTGGLQKSRALIISSSLWVYVQVTTSSQGCYECCCQCFAFSVNAAKLTVGLKVRCMPHPSFNQKNSRMTTCNTQTHGSIAKPSRWQVHSLSIAQLGCH